MHTRECSRVILSVHTISRACSMKPPWTLNSSSVFDEKSNFVCNYKAMISKWRRAEGGMMARERKNSPSTLLH